MIEKEVVCGVEGVEGGRRSEDESGRRGDKTTKGKGRLGSNSLKWLQEVRTTWEGDLFETERIE